MHVFIYVYMHACMYLFIYLSMCVFIYLSMCVYNDNVSRLAASGLFWSSLREVVYGTIFYGRLFSLNPQPQNWWNRFVRYNRLASS